MTLFLLRDAADRPPFVAAGDRVVVLGSVDAAALLALVLAHRRVVVW